jgi:methionyl-tRNA formyltransferase
MRLVLMGTGPFAVPTFEMLRSEGHVLLSVVTRPQAVTTTKKGPPPSPVNQWAVEHLLPTHSPDSINVPESIDWLRSLDADLFVVCDYGQILSSDCLAASKWGGINLHGSLLPRHRGAAPVQWSILSGDQQAGVSVIHMTPGLDAGPVLSQDAIPIPIGANAAELEQQLSQLGVSTVKRSLVLLEQSSGQVAGMIQDATLATKAPRLKKEDGQIQVDRPVRLLDRQLRGLFPWPGCYGELELPNGNRLRVILHRGFPVEDRRPSPSQWPPQNCDAAIGDVVMGEEMRRILPQNIKPASLGIVVSDGVFCIEILQPAGKKPMAAEEFVRGYQKMGRLRFLPSESSPKLLDKMLKMEGAS